MDVETASPLFALALGCGKRDDVETIYQNMLEYARHKGELRVYIHKQYMYTESIMQCMYIVHVHIHVHVHVDNLWS